MTNDEVLNDEGIPNDEFRMTKPLVHSKFVIHSSSGISSFVIPATDEL